MFNYFYGDEIMHYTFLKMPWILLKDDFFKGLTGYAKILYSLLLNRTSLSAENGWKDKQGRVYIIYTINEIMEDLNCHEGKAINLMKELKEIGLIKSIRQGQGKPNITYVMNYETSLKYQSERTKISINPVDSLNCENRNSGTAKIAIQELPESQSINTENINTDLKKISPPILSPLPEGKNGKSKTDEIGYDMILPCENVEKIKESLSTSAKATQSNRHTDKPSTNKYNYNQVTDFVKEKIDYEYLIDTHENEKGLIREILFTIVSTVCSDYPDGYITMGEARVPAEIVKSEFLKLDYQHVEYFLECFNKLTEPVTKLPSYIRTSLFNNRNTIDHYTANRVRVDNPYIAGS